MVDHTLVVENLEARYSKTRESALKSLVVTSYMTLVKLANHKKFCLPLETDNAIALTRVLKQYLKGNYQSCSV